MDSFGVNSLKSCDTYLDIQTISVKTFYRYRKVLQLWYKVRLHRTSYENVIKFFVQPVATGSSQKPVVVTQISLPVGPISIDFFASTDSET
jgi:hypothetical protein